MTGNQEDIAQKARTVSQDGSDQQKALLTSIILAMPLLQYFSVLQWKGGQMFYIM